MKIGFDAKRAFLNRTGLGNYSRSVIGGLTASFPGHEYFLYSPRVEWNAQNRFLQNRKNISLRKPAIPLFTALWRSRFILSQLKADGLDLYHGLSHEIPVGIGKTGIKSIVTIHDLIIFRYPEYYPLTDRKIYESKLRHACRHADYLIAISEQTRRDLVTFLQVPEEKIRVVYQSCHPDFLREPQPGSRDAVIEKYRLPQRFLLYVGTIEERKNLMLVARALKKLPREIPCVVIGRKTSYWESVHRFLQENRLGDRMIFPGHIPSADLPALYQAAEIFLYPSEFEGFGIPVLEAISAGTPVVAASGSCLEEAGGPGSRYLDPHDPDGWAAVIESLWHDQATRRQMKEAGRQYALRFTEARASRSLMDLYMLCLGKG